MKRFAISFVSLLFVAALTSSCISIESRTPRGAKGQPRPYTYTFSTSYEATWDALVKALVEDLRLDISQLDEKHGLVTLSEEIIPIGRYCDCGGFKGTALSKVEIRLKHTGKEGNLLTIDAGYSTEIELKNNLGQVVKKRKVQCFSTGRMEEEIVWHIKRRLNL